VFGLISRDILKLKRMAKLLNIISKLLKKSDFRLESPLT
jgi:hypothetical protein